MIIRIKQIIRHRLNSLSCPLLPILLNCPHSLCTLCPLWLIFFSITDVKLKNMKRFVVFVTIILAVGSLAQAQQFASKKKEIERIAARVEQSFAASDLGRLDRAGLLQGSVKIVIGHSLLEGEEEIVERRFPSLYRAERWLWNRHPQAGLPARAVGEFRGCRKGACDYSYDNGILHNHLYLEKILYGYRNGRPFIREIHFLDGD